MTVQQRVVVVYNAGPGPVSRWQDQTVPVPPSRPELVTHRAALELVCSFLCYLHIQLVQYIVQDKVNNDLLLDVSILFVCVM